MGTPKRFLVILALAAFPCILAAQDSGGSGSRVSKTDQGFFLSQTITFPPVPNMLYYKVELERFAGESPVPFDVIQTETNSIEVSLRAGLYRYRILAYNKMNLLDGVSDWQEFEVIAAIEPAAEAYRPFYGLYYEMAAASGSITVSGRDFFSDSEFALVQREENFDWSGVNLEDQDDTIFPDKVLVNDDHTLAVLDFSRKSLKAGDYLIFIRNPGGLWTTLGQVRVGSKNGSDWTLSFGWSPMIPAFDPGSDTYWDHTASANKPVLDAFNHRGAYFRIGWLPVKTKIGNFGLEGTWFFLADNYWVSRHENPTPLEYINTISGGYLGIVYQKAFASWKSWQLEIRAGVGSGAAYDDVFYANEDTLPLLINAGVSVQYFIWKNLYAEAGLDFQYMTRVDHFMLRPALGLGWQFGRWAETAEVDRAIKRGNDPSVPVTGIPKNEGTVSLGWSPMIPLFDSTYTDSFGHESSDLGMFNPLGAYLRIAYLPHRWDDNKFGFEFALYILEHANRETYGNYKMLDLVRYGQFGVLYQRKLPDNWQVNARFGAGIANPYDPQADNVAIPFALNAGLSIQRFLWKGLYAELGLDFIVSFGDQTHWIMNPGLGIGWQFNLDAETGLRLK
ncbi:MAG: hypothetical protein LBH35_01035 [Treponema sp.]|jgi:hypothetical protein|nr:hypothetical protein [Treponema sp.]